MTKKNVKTELTRDEVVELLNVYIFCMMYHTFSLT